MKLGVKSHKRVGLQLHYENHDFVLLLAVRYGRNNVYSLSAAARFYVTYCRRTIKTEAPLQGNA